MGLLHVLIVGVVPAAVCYAIAAFIYRRKGLRTKNWYAFIGASIAVLLGFALAGYFGIFSDASQVTITAISAAIAIISALQWRPPTGQNNK